MLGKGAKTVMCLMRSSSTDSGRAVNVYMLSLLCPLNSELLRSTHHISMARFTGVYWMTLATFLWLPDKRVYGNGWR